jgi:tetratricopeptide (TPR) repeat protein
MKYLLFLFLTGLITIPSLGFQSASSFSLGMDAFENEKWREAQRNFDQWIQTHPSDEDAYWYRGQSFQQLGNLDRALSDFNSLLTLNPNRSEVIFERGRVRYLLKQYEEARGDFETYLKTPPGETTRILYKISPGQTGISAVTTDQTDRRDQAYFHLGLCSIAQEEYDFAIQYLEEAISINPKEPDFYAEKGRALARIGDNVPAIESYEQALVLNPNHLPAIQGLAQVKTGGDEVLLSQLDDLIADSAASAQTYKQRGFYRMNHADEEGAVADFSQAIVMDSLDSESFFYRGKIHSRQKKWPQAELDYSAALLLEPENAEYYLARGQARYQSGKPEAALADFTLTVTTDPEHESGYYHRGITYQRLGKIALACTDLSKAVSLGMEAANPVLEKVCKSN